MSSVMLKPALKTAGGEVCDIVFKNRFVGTLTIVYRESARIAGSLQLEKEVLPEADKDEVFEHVHEYVQAFMDAIEADACEIMVTYSSYDHVIATERTAAGRDNRRVGSEEDFDCDVDWVDHDSRLEDEDSDEREEYSMADYELVVVGEDEDTIEYHIYDKEENWVAEAIMHVEGGDITGTVIWMMEPRDEDLEAAANLLVMDFHEDEVDTFVIHMLFDNEVIETIELTHEDLLQDNGQSFHEPTEYDKKQDYTITLARDDGDVLSYEIYQHSRGGLPIGTATIDISQRLLTGFIDFREPGSEGDRELIATLLMEELDKEKDYDAINLSMMHRNKLIEEILFETETIH